MPYMKSRNGFALVIVMWIVAALLLGIAFIINISKENLTLTKGVQDKLSARLEAQSYLEVLKYYVMTANYDSVKLINNTNITHFKLPPQIVLDGRKYHPTAQVTFSMQDASSMINLLYPDAQMIAALASDGNQKLYYTIKDSIKDWTDADRQTSLNGAEDAYYHKQKGARYGPRNYPALQSIYELKLIRGVNTLNKKTFNKLKKYLYFSQKGSAVDIALINTEYLSKLLHIDMSTAQQIEGYKQDDYSKFITILQKNKYYDDEYMGFALSFNIKISIKVKIGNAVSILKTFIDFRKNKYRNYTTDFYRIY